MYDLNIARFTKNGKSAKAWVQNFEIASTVPNKTISIGGIKSSYAGCTSIEVTDGQKINQTISIKVIRNKAIDRTKLHLNRKFFYTIVDSPSLIKYTD